MPQGYVETKSGSRVRPPRYGVSPSCSPLWRRYCHDCSFSNAGPWRRLHDIPERPWTGLIPPVRGQRGHELLSGARPGRRLGRRVRPVGPMARSQGGCPGQRDGRAGDATPDRRGPLRACPVGRSDGRLYPSGHTPDQPRALRGDTFGPALAWLAAAGGDGAGLADLGDEPVADAHRGSVGGRCGGHDEQQTKHHGGQGAGSRPAGFTALPDPPYSTRVGRPAGHRGGEP